MNFANKLPRKTYFYFEDEKLQSEFSLNKFWIDRKKIIVNLIRPESNMEQLSVSSHRFSYYRTERIFAYFEAVCWICVTRDARVFKLYWKIWESQRQGQNSFFWFMDVWVQEFWYSFTLNNSDNDDWPEKKTRFHICLVRPYAAMSWHRDIFLCLLRASFYIWKISE